MCPSLVMKGNVVPNRLSSLSHRSIGFQIDLFILDCSPKAFYEDVVSPASFAIHADPDVILFELGGKSLASELTSLICIEYLWSAIE